MSASPMIAALFVETNGVYFNLPNAGSKLHPHQKPVALLSHCLEACQLEPGDVVVDPYMGSSSCGVAAMRRGLKYIGVEIDPQWFEVACRRIEEAYRQGDMFREAPAPKAEQLGMLP